VRPREGPLRGVPIREDDCGVRCEKSFLRFALGFIAASMRPSVVFSLVYLSLAEKGDSPEMISPPSFSSLNFRLRSSIEARSR
jgi:hypothetical protein